MRDVLLEYNKSSKAFLKILIFFLTIAALNNSLYARGPYTLTNLKCVNTSVRSETTLLNDEDMQNIEIILVGAMKETKLQANKRDCPTLRVTVEILETKPNYYLYTRLHVGEDTVTKRNQKTETFALTYSASDFIQTQDIHYDVLESVQYLADEFVNHYDNDNEK